MKTSISSKAFVALPTDRRTKYLQNRCSFMRGICTKKIGAISQLGAEKITFPPKRGWHSDRRTDICFYRVVLLNVYYICLKLYFIIIVISFYGNLGFLKVLNADILQSWIFYTPLDLIVLALRFLKVLRQF